MIIRTKFDNAWCLEVKETTLIGCLKCVVVNYGMGDQDFPATQYELTDEINSLSSLSILQIESAKAIASLREGVLNLPHGNAPDFDRMALSHATRNSSGNHVKIHREPVIQWRVDWIEVPISKLSFLEKRVQFDYKPKGILSKSVVTIENENIRAEFDPIKKYFGKVLGLKSVRVKLSIQSINGIDQEIKAESDDVNRIDLELLLEVKITFLRRRLRDVGRNSWRELILTEDELLETLDGNTGLLRGEPNILGCLASLKEIKHREQLELLSELHLAKLMKLRFILEPFSYICLVKGITRYMLIWETVFTEEATYVWWCSNEISNSTLPVFWKQVEKALYRISDTGRNRYKRLPNKNFKDVDHKYCEGGFQIWCGRMSEIDRLFHGGPVLS